jgi:hypothetical protein
LQSGPSNLAFVREEIGTLVEILKVMSVAFGRAVYRSVKLNTT